LAAYEIDVANKTLADPASEHPLVNDACDRRIMAAFEAADSDFLMSLTSEDVVQNGGHGANEILNWMAVMGAMNGQEAQIVGYEPVIEWICGMGYLVY
jgi:2,3-dihydroxyphenylpropionate 1,2-dioxygenase